MERKTIPESEQRLTILYTLRVLEAVTEGQLLQFMVELDLMNYFTLQPALIEMEERGQLRRRSHPCGSLLCLSEAGAHTLAEFEQRIPASKRSLIDDRGSVWLRRFRLEQQTPAEAVHLPDGRDCLRLRLLEGDSSLLDIMLTLPEGEKIRCLAEKWHRSAERVLQAVVAALMMEPVAADTLPEDTALQPVGDADWLLTLNGGTAEEPMVLLMPLKDEPLARAAAVHWQTQAEPLRQLILQALREEIQ